MLTVIGILIMNGRSAAAKETCKFKWIQFSFMIKCQLYFNVLGAIKEQLQLDHQLQLQLQPQLQPQLQLATTAIVEKQCLFPWHVYYSLSISQDSKIK